MSDPYLYEEVPVLKNKLGIKNEQTRAFPVGLKCICHLRIPCVASFSRSASLQFIYSKKQLVIV